MGIFEQSLRELMQEALRDVVTEEVVPLLRRDRDSNPDKKPEFLSAEQAAGLIGVSAETIREWARDGRLKPYRAGRLLRVRLDELEEYLGRSLADGSIKEKDLDERALAIVRQRKVVR